jgi:hypothetical protein
MSFENLKIKSFYDGTTAKGNNTTFDNTFN